MKRVAFVLIAAAWCGTPAAPLRSQGAPAAAQLRAKLSPAADSALDARTSAVASQLRCPVCQGLSIQASPSELAQQMRSVVRDQLAAGRSPADVQAYFVSKYGEWILLAPAPRGINLFVYAAPVLLALGGLLAVGLAVRRWTSAPTGPALH
jgi:cytochrome c-type biogenesis protein CcmH